MSSDILVDGYNVIKNNVMFQALEIRNLALARETLLRQLKNRYCHSPDRVMLVFDGSDAREQRHYDDHICIIYSRHGETADSVIARLAQDARQAGRGIILYSDDGEVKQQVVEQGGQLKTTHQLTRRLNAAPRDLEARVQHRQMIRRTYGIDPWHKGDDQPEPHRTAHPKQERKKKRRR